MITAKAANKHYEALAAAINAAMANAEPIDLTDPADIDPADADADVGAEMLAA